MSKRQRRKEVNTKKELLEYLKDNPRSEYPFVEEVWKVAVKNTKDKERQFKKIKVKEFDGKTTTKKIPNGNVNPVSMYFQLMALPQYQRMGKELRAKLRKPRTTKRSTGDVANISYAGDDNEDKIIKGWLNTFFKGYKADERRFLADRLSDYYDNYELNDGADKMLAVKAVTDELEIMRLTRKRAANKDVENPLEKVQKGYLALLESLKALKKQRSAMDAQGKNKFTLFVDELEREGEDYFDFEDKYDGIDEMLSQFKSYMVASFSDG